MSLRSIYTALKIKPTTARNLKEYSFLCACGALWNAVYLYHVLQWSHLHGMMDQVDSKSFSAALNISLFGAPDLSPVPVFVIVVRIVSRFLFWGGSSIILASYSSKMDRYADGFRLVGFLFFATICLDITTTFLATGRDHLLFSGWFGSVRETLTTLILLSVLTFVLFPRRKATQ
jgi:hypothetical protein